VIKLHNHVKCFTGRRKKMEEVYGGGK